jgi:hypothetical protein
MTSIMSEFVSVLVIPVFLNPVIFEKSAFFRTQESGIILKV